MANEPSPREVFLEGMTMLSAAYNRKWDDAHLDVYWRVLNGLDSERMRQAFEDAVKNERFLPTPATVRAYAREARQSWQSEEHVEPIAPEQLEEMRADIRRLKQAMNENTAPPWMKGN